MSKKNPNQEVMRYDFTCDRCGEKGVFVDIPSKTFPDREAEIDYATKRFEEMGWMFTSREGLCPKCANNETKETSKQFGPGIYE